MSKILITGGTGSFGNATIKRLIGRKNISEIIVFSRDEKKQHDMKYLYNSKKIRYVIGDVRSYHSIKIACEGVDIIFHAAALKHVPTGEFFPMEVIRTNILGTENVINAAIENNVKKVIFLSTDKAVYPINAMGMSKALAEKLMISRLDKSKNTKFCIVRYGNVMASRGSVIPLFIDSIKNKKPCNITDLEMTRFLLSLDDAVDLVELAIKSGRQGDIFIKKAPAATIGDIAEAIMKIFNSNVGIKIIGTRSGEKKHETLATSSELLRAKDMGHYYSIKGRLSDYDNYYNKGLSDPQLDYTSNNTKRLSVSEIKKILLSLDYIKKEIASMLK